MRTYHARGVCDASAHQTSLSSWNYLKCIGSLRTESGNDMGEGCSCFSNGQLFVMTNRMFNDEGNDAQSSPIVRAEKGELQKVSDWVQHRPSKTRLPFPLYCAIVPLQQLSSLLSRMNENRWTSVLFSEFQTSWEVVWLCCDNVGKHTVQVEWAPAFSLLVCRYGVGRELSHILSDWQF